MRGRRLEHPAAKPSIPNRRAILNSMKGQKMNREEQIETLKEILTEEQAQFLKESEFWGEL